MTLDDSSSARRAPALATWLGLIGLVVALLGSLLVWVWGGDWRVVTTTVVIGFVILVIAMAVAGQHRGGERD